MGNMIDKLTPEMEARLPEYITMAARDGLSTAPLDRAAIRQSIDRLYTEVLGEKKGPSRLLFRSSPLQCHHAACVAILANEIGKGKTRTYTQLLDEVKAGLPSMPVDVKAYTDSLQLGPEARCCLEGIQTQMTELERSTRPVATVWEKLMNWLRRPIPVMPDDDEAPIRCIPEYIEDGNMPDFVWPYIDGHYSAGYFTHYKFLTEACEVTIDLPKFVVYAETINHGPVWPLIDQDICIVCERPSIAKYNERGLHSVNGPALGYRDSLFGDFALYALNGVIVPKEVVEVRVEDIDRDWLRQHFFKQANVEIRREILRKIGVERMVEICEAEVLDRMGTYSLLRVDLQLPGTPPTHYLKMLNPSTGTWHVEGVAPECTTCRAALLWANNIPEDRVDDENGMDWYQQGDVLVFPAEYRNDPAVKLKSTPKVLW